MPSPEDFLPARERKSADEFARLLMDQVDVRVASVRAELATFKGEVGQAFVEIVQRLEAVEAALQTDAHRQSRVAVALDILKHHNTFDFNRSLGELANKTVMEFLGERTQEDAPEARPHAVQDSEGTEAESVRPSLEGTPETPESGG